MPIIPGHKLLQKIANALGLEGRKVRRLVVDVAVDNIVKVYIEEFPDVIVDEFVTALAQTQPDVIHVERVKVGNGDGASIDVSATRGK